MMPWCWKKQGDCKPSFGSGIRYRIATLHGSELWKAIEYLQDYIIQYEILLLVFECQLKPEHACTSGLQTSKQCFAVCGVLTLLLNHSSNFW